MILTRAVWNSSSIAKNKLKIENDNFKSVHIFFNPNKLDELVIMNLKFIPQIHPSASKRSFFFFLIVTYYERQIVFDYERLDYKCTIKFTGEIN